MNYYATGEAFDIYECDACGMRFTQDAPIEAEAAQYYSSPDYISHTDIRKGLFNRTYHAVRTVMLRRKAHLVMKALGSKEGRLLDIGAGTGYFAREMQRRGFAVEAVEVSEDARKVAEKNAGIKEKDISALATFENESFDAITMWHVLEHMEHLNETWAHLRRLLAPRGVLIIAVPNSSSFDARKYGAHWAAYDVPRHLWHFTPDTMQRFGAKHGFILAERYPMPFDAFYISMLTEKYMHRSCPFLRGLINGTLAWFSALVKKERSSSMIYVFRKKKSGGPAAV